MTSIAFVLGVLPLMIATGAGCALRQAAGGSLRTEPSGTGMHRIWVDDTEKQHWNRWVILPVRDPTPGSSPVTSTGERVSRQCPGGGLG